VTWLVGIQPGKRGDPPLKATGGRSSTADRLRLMLNMTVEEYEQTFPNRVNVFDRGRGSRLRPRLDGMVFVLGKQAWACLHLPPARFWSIHTSRYASFMLIPHPSGRNLVYNDPKMRRTLREVMTNAFRHS